MSFNNYRVDSIHTHGVVESDLTLSEATELAQRLANEDGHTYCVCTNGGSPRQYVYPTPAETPTAEDGTLPIGTPVKVTKATYYRGEPVTSVFNGVIESVRKDGRGYTVTIPGISGMAHYVDFKEVEAIGNTPSEPRYNGNGDEIFHGVTAEGEVFGIEVTDTPTAEVEDQGYSEWIDLIESQVYVNAEARVHRDFSSQSGVQGFVGVQKTSGQDDVRECAGCEDSENAPHESDCTRVCGTRYGYNIEGKPVVCDLSVGHAGSHLDRTHSAPAQFYWESV